MEARGPELARYESTYRRSVRRVARPASALELSERLLKADVVLVGDYHTFAPAQRHFYRVLRSFPDGPRVIALEMLASKHQRHVDRYLAGRLSERSFIERTELGSRWPFARFDVIRPIFELARARGYRVIGIDCDDPTVTSLDARDRIAAQAIVAGLEHGPVAALIGDMHLSPSHLPRSIGELDRASRIVRVHQNPDGLWFDLEDQGIGHDHDLVLLEDGGFALVDASPIALSESFLTWLEAQEEDDDDIVASELTFERLVRTSLGAMGQALQLDVPRALDGLEIAGPYDLTFFERLVRSNTLRRREIEHVRHQVLARESCYIPKAQLIYLATPSLNHAAEESAHRLRHVESGEGVRVVRDPIDSFYVRTLNEAVGFLGSKIVNPKRRAAHEAELLAISASETSLQSSAAKLALAHLGLGDKVPGALFEIDPALFDAAAHVLGYALGDQLWLGLSRGRIESEQASELFRQPFEGPGQAREIYFGLRARVGSLKPRPPAIRRHTFPGLAPIE